MKKSPTKKPNSIRIIGGKWRGRILRFPDMPALRPTPNRIRETLFNWLSPIIYGANCLDLFAGSGALGFEALSRGATSVTLVDNQSVILEHLKQNKALLNAEQATILNVNLTALSPLFPSEKPFNIVFLDPPFDSDLIATCCNWLEAQGLLAENAYVYIEAEKSLRPLPTPPHWQLLKSKVAGQVGYHLLTVVPVQTD